MALPLAPLGDAFAQEAAGSGLHDFKVCGQRIPFAGLQGHAIHEGVDGFPPQAHGEAGAVHMPAAEDAREKAHGPRVVGPDGQFLALVVFQLPAFATGFGLGDGRLQQCAGGSGQFPRRLW